MVSERLSKGERIDGATNNGVAPLLIRGEGKGVGDEQRMDPITEDEADHQQGGVAGTN